MSHRVEPRVSAVDVPMRTNFDTREPGRSNSRFRFSQQRVAKRQAFGAETDRRNDRFTVVHFRNDLTPADSSVVSPSDE